MLWRTTNKEYYDIVNNIYKLSYIIENKLKMHKLLNLLSGCIKADQILSNYDFKFDETIN